MTGALRPGLWNSASMQNKMTPQKMDTCAHDQRSRGQHGKQGLPTGSCEHQKAPSE